MASAQAYVTMPFTSGATPTYARHIAIEDNEVFPLAGRVLSQDQLAQVGREMAQRRGQPSGQWPRHRERAEPLSQQGNAPAVRLVGGAGRRLTHVQRHPREEPERKRPFPLGAALEPFLQVEQREQGRAPLAHRGNVATARATASGRISTRQ